MPLTPAMITDAEADVAALGAVVNGAPTDPDVVTRSGRQISPVAKMVASIHASEQTASASATTAVAAKNDAQAVATALAGASASAVAASTQAGAYRDAVLAAVSGLPAGSQLTLQAVTIADLKAFTGMAAGRQAMLGQAGRVGLFTWTVGDLSAKVTLDTYEGVYVAPASAPTGATGAWVRQVDQLRFLATWWDVDDNNQARARLQSAITLLNTYFPGAILRPPAKRLNAFGAGTPAIQSALTIRGPMTLLGYGSDISQLDVTGGHSSNSHTLNICASNVRVEGMGFRGLYTPDNADARFMINIGTRFNQCTAGAETKDIDLVDILVENASTGIRSIVNGWREGSVDRWYIPDKIRCRGIKLRNIGYQAVVPWCDGFTIEDFEISMDPNEASRPWQCPFRVNAAMKFRAYNGTIDDPKGLGCFRIMTGGVDGGPGMVQGSYYRDPEDIEVRGVTYRGVGGLVSVLELNGLAVFNDCTYARDQNATSEAGGIGIGQSQMPMKRGRLHITNCRFLGCTHIVTNVSTNLKELVISGCRWRPNARVAPATGNGAINFSISGLDTTGAPIRGTDLFIFENNDVLFPDSMHNWFAYITVTVAGTVIRMENNRLPYGVAVVLGHGGAGDAAESGNDRRYPAGVAAKAVTNQAVTPRFTNP